MITAELVVGKLGLFICQKAAQSIAKLPFDKRKKACRSLTKLYYCFQALDDVTESIFQCIRQFRQSESGEAKAVMNSLNNHMHEIALATNMFVDLGHELHGGLEILDPALARCCDALYVGKYDFLTQMSASIAWDRSEHGNRIIVKMPRQTVDLPTLENAYCSAKAAFQRGEKHYWPDTWGTRESEEDVILSWDDNINAENFVNRLAQHRAVLIDAKEKLRELLKSSFSVEELLFQTDAHPYR